MLKEKGITFVIWREKDQAILYKVLVKLKEE